HSGAVVPPDRGIGRPAPRARDQVMGEAVTVTVTAGIGVPGVDVGVRSTCSRSISCSGFTLVRCSSRGLFSFSTNERCWLHGIDCVWPYCQLYGRARESFSDFWNGVSTRVKSRSRNWFCFWCCCSRCHCLFLFFFLAPFFLRFSTKAWGFCIC